MQGTGRQILTVGLACLLSMVIAAACDGRMTPATANLPPTPDSLAAKDAIVSPRVESVSTRVSPGETSLIPATSLETTAVSGTWRGIVVAPEHRCAPYDSDDYRYSQSVEQRIVAGMGGIIYGPYTGTWFASTSETDIEHIIARSEAHDSGLCAANAATRRQLPVTCST